MASSNAIQVVRETLEAVLPPGVHPSFSAILAARYEGTGRTRAITAELRMIDGHPATVRLTPWAFGWSHRFTSLPGGDLSFEDGRWVRIGADGEPVLPLFANTYAGAAA